LYLDVNPETGSIKVNSPGRDVWDLPATCALDLADRGPQTLQTIGELLGITRERVRQIEAKALKRLRAAFAREGLDPAQLLVERQEHWSATEERPGPGDWAMVQRAARKYWRRHVAGRLVSA
jgi:hypothetical protein